MTRQCSKPDFSVLECSKSMQPCFAMSSHPVRSLEPSELLILHIAAPFLQGPRGWTTGLVGGTGLATSLQPSSSQGQGMWQPVAPGTGEWLFCLKESDNVLVLQMHERLYWSVNGSVPPGKAREVDGVGLMLYNTIDQLGNQEERKWNHAVFVYLSPSFPRPHLTVFFLVQLGKYLPNYEL